ncbi:hypothetical protein Afil01_31190 [Actinorhabdospora filicis]|uniref:Uncharacterized protein n=1 Tax=Actinorhabdospora filicis TaxID=1785913 RepID=A0A9W6SLV8_9ACTN|nr:hypothetical protein [Actinorhabdospora filicis]GLZ78312.1 hypothetical protein Afil01_31190 [Actinorhabdospora filicis]
MGVLGIARELLAPQAPGRTRGVALTIWWGPEEIIAVRPTPDGGEPVVFDGWPALPVTGDDTSMWRTIIEAAGLPAGAVIAAATPWTWGPARRTAWQRAAEPHVTARTVSSTSVLDALIGDEFGPLKGAWALVEGAEHPSVAILALNTGTPPQLLGQAAAPAATPRDLIAAAVTAADLGRPPDAVALIANPSRTSERAALERDCGVPVCLLSTLALASRVAAIDAEEHPVSAAPVRPQRASIAATTAALLLSVALVASVVADASSAGGIVRFSPGHLAAGTAALSVAITAIGMLLVHAHLADAGTWDWATAGRWLFGAAFTGLLAAGASGLALAALAGTPAGQPLAWSVLPAAPALACYAAIGWELKTRPDPAPARRIWPPMAPIALGVLGILGVRAVEPLFAGMPLGHALIARAGLVVTAAATAMVLSSRPSAAAGIACALGLVYALTASASTGTTACLLLVAAITIRAAASLAGLLGDRRPSKIAHPVTGS